AGRGRAGRATRRPRPRAACGTRTGCPPSRSSTPASSIQVYGRGVLRIAVTTALAVAGCREVREHDTSDARSSDARPDVLDPDDGAPIRLPCTSNFGSALSTGYGRLDGIPVAVAPPGG